MKLNKVFMTVLVSMLILPLLSIPVSAQSFECEGDSDVYCTIAEVLNSLFAVEISDTELVSDILFLIIVPTAGVFAILSGIFHTIRIFPNSVWIQEILALIIAFSILGTETWANIIVNLFRSMGLYAVILFTGVFFIGATIWGRGSIHNIRGEYKGMYKDRIKSYNRKARDLHREYKRKAREFNSASSPQDEHRIFMEIQAIESRMLKMASKAERVAIHADKEVDIKYDNQKNFEVDGIKHQIRPIKKIDIK